MILLSVRINQRSDFPKAVAGTMLILLPSFEDDTDKKRNHYNRHSEHEKEEEGAEAKPDEREHATPCCRRIVGIGLRVSLATNATLNGKARSRDEPDNALFCITVLTTHLRRYPDRRGYSRTRVECMQEADTVAL